MHARAFVLLCATALVCGSAFASPSSDDLRFGSAPEPARPRAGTGGVTSAGEPDALLRSPLPGAIYKEFVRINSVGGETWRVTEPGLLGAPATFLPNPILPLEIGDLDSAIYAEALISLWGGHPGTTWKQMRFNGNDWIDIPELLTTPTPPECFMQQANVVVEVPIADLVEGPNEFEGTNGGQTCYDGNWGQWGWYTVVLRVYYDPSKPHPTGSITSPVNGGTLGEHPTIAVAANAAPGSSIARVEVFAYYDGYDVDGDGVYLDWQQNYHRGRSDTVSMTQGHVGSDSTAPYQVVWDTDFVPDPPAGSIRLLARILGADGTWFVTEEVVNLSLDRPGTRAVKLYKPIEVLPNYWVRAGNIKRSKVVIPFDHDLSGASWAAVLLRTWNGVDGAAEPGDIHYVKLNTYELPQSYGSNHYYAYDVEYVPLATLRNGENTFAFHSTSIHHGIEILWPGPAVLVYYDDFCEPSPLLTALPATASPGGAVTGAWSGLCGVQSTGWIGLYEVGADNEDFVSWMFYGTCSQSAGTPQRSGACPVPLPASLPAGEYELRLFADVAYNLVVTSAPFTVEAGAGGGGPTIAGNPDTLEPGDVLTTTWSGIVAPTPADWFGLYPDGAANNAPTDWQYVDCSKSPSGAFAAGVCPLTVPANAPPGTYELRLFSNNSYNRLATSDPIEVEAPGGGGGLTFEVDPDTVERGNPTTVEWSGIPTPFPRDWIGLYASPGAAPGAWLDWYYVSCTRAAGAAKAAGSCPLNVPASLAAGPYHVRLYSNNSYNLLASTVLNVTAPAGGGTTLDLDPNAIGAGGLVQAAWMGIPGPTPRDWIGLYRVGMGNNAYVDWKYAGTCTRTPGAAPPVNGSCPFALAANLAPGTYEARLFPNNSYNALATSDLLTVQPPAPPAITVDPTNAPAGGAVDVDFSGIVAPKSTDWIGLYANGAANAAFLQWFYAGSCTKTAGPAVSAGSCAVNLPAALPNGSYQFRLFANNGFALLATSNGLTVP